MSDFTVKIMGVPPYDGEYPVAVDQLTNRDHHTIKRLSGYTAQTYVDALRSADVDFVMALGIVAVRHSGRFGPQILEDPFWDAKLGSVTIAADEAVEDEGVADPPTTSAGETPSTPSGESSNGASDTPPAVSLVSTGHPS